jgi:thiosulfate dehydrogenase (quinone) large subunit
VARRRQKFQPQPPKPRTQAVAAPLDPRIRYAVLFLRLFLGVTFVYAALQKFSDPGFLHPGSATYIGTQLQGFARTSPIAFLLNAVAIPMAPLVGLGTMLTELVVGGLVLAGVYTRGAAAVGALLNFTLFLTASWQVQPYFLGSDSIYTVAWIVLAVAGDLGFWTVRLPASAPRPDLGRREMLIRAGGAAIGLVWVLALLPRLSPPRARSEAQLTPTPAGSPAGGATPSAAPTPPPGTPIGTMAQLQQNGSLPFQIPTTGDPGIVVGLSANQVVAFDAVCTHAGCTVEYDPSQRLLVCPCHGAEYDPAHAAEVVAGPAPSPLQGLKAAVAADGTIYVQ